VLGALLFVARRRTGGERAALAAAGAYLFHPGVVFDTAYWGQADALGALFVVAAVIAARRRPEWAWAALALAVLTKPLAYPFLPLLALLTTRWFGWRRAVAGGVVFAGVALVVCLPFVLQGRSGALARSLILQIDAMPYASVNAHNVWWLVQRGVPWLDARRAILGPLSAEGVGFVLFAAFYLWVLRRAWVAEGEQVAVLSFASVAFGLFVLATHMHENHLFNLIPLLVLAGPGLPRWLFVGASATFCGNMLLHDPYLTHVLRPHVPGPHLMLPPAEIDPRLAAYFAGQGFPQIVEALRGETSVVGLFLTALNSQANVLLLAAWIGTFHRREAFALRTGIVRGTRPWARLAAAVFVVLSGVWFLWR
jgi:hypothetical protein